LIPIEDKSSSYFLGPVGISDPLEFIEVESNRIPFKSALSRPHAWQDAFKNWPLPPIAGWRNCYKRILEDKSVKRIHVPLQVQKLHQAKRSKNRIWI
jgi:hypothetical protein